LPVARIVKSFGSNGEIIIRYSPQFDDDIDTKRPVFIYFDGLPVPFFITSVKDRGKSDALIQLRTISDQKAAEEIIGEYIYIECAESDSVQENQIEEIIGYSVEDKRLGKIGSVSDIYYYPNNPCLAITSYTTHQEHLLPIHEDLISAIDHKKKSITVIAPDGLFEL
jgi:16S rRNA processing protein RimM